MAGAEGRYWTAQQAAEVLGVTRATLYAYASRGQLRSEPEPGRSKQCRYHREDIERLRERKATRRAPAEAAARALHWGSPVLASAITVIHDGRLYYRGQDVLRLAEKESLEQVAGLLWAAEAEQDRLFEQPCALSRRQLANLRICAKDPLTLFQSALPIAGAMDLASYDLRPAAVRQTGARIIRLFTTIVAGSPPAVQTPAHLALQRAWAPKKVAVGEVIRKALVVVADHELNVSTFAARCAASAGASPYDAVSAAMATVRGHRHGGATERVAALFVETAKPGRAQAVMANRLRQGERLPGFGHPLYPAGDPRAALLLRLAEESGNKTEGELVRALSRSGSELLQDLPNLDFALVALGRTYRLPDRSPLILFALGRTIGWIAHAIEQYASAELIRPRARYTGPALEDAGPPEVGSGRLKTQ